MSRCETMPRVLFGSAVLVVLHASTARADIAEVRDAAEIWRQWSWDPFLLGSFVVAGFVYGRGARQLWRAAGPGRGISRGRLACFFGGLGCLFVALVSPLDALSAALFSAHMLQHLLLVALAAPLVVLGRPLLAVAWAVPSSQRRHLRRVLRAPVLRAVVDVATRPMVALALHAAALWLWHMPAFYEAALRSELVHWLEHASFFGTSVLLWHVLLGSALDPGLRILYLFASATQSAVLGALLTLAPTAWYTAHDAGARAWGLDLLEDQQLAGLIMWIPGGVIYLAAALVAFAGWLGQSERAVRRREAVRGPYLGERRRA